MRFSKPQPCASIHSQARSRGSGMASPAGSFGVRSCDRCDISPECPAQLSGPRENHQRASPAPRAAGAGLSRTRLLGRITGGGAPCPRDRRSCSPRRRP
ncbi:hypothetical protein ACFPRL_32635 [Pseudoclavibacter helvolus]